MKIVYFIDMSIVKPKIIVILGPTASGKSDAAIKFAHEIGGEIISADSRQVFRGLNIGSGKVTKDRYRISDIGYQNTFYSEGIMHHLIDVADPETDFNVSHFKKAAQEAIEKILTKDKVPIICGGTGFWISALVNNVELPTVKPNPDLRNKLASKTAAELFAQLQKLDPERAANIDAKNKVRLIRAIEIAKVLGKVPKAQSANQKAQDIKYNFLQIGIEVPREDLNAKIKKRLKMRFEEGMLTEVEQLLQSGVHPEWLEKIGLEYRWLKRYLQNEVGLEEMQEKLYFDIIHFAKRQMTWFQKDSSIHWAKDYAAIKELAQKFLAK